MAGKQVILEFSCGTNIMSHLGSCHTSNFDKQYYDKKIKQYCDKTIYFLLCEFKISMPGYFS